MADLPQWQEIASKLPDSIPDTEYDAVRDKFFHNMLWPAMIHSGKADPYQYSGTLEDFMKKSERSDKSSFPRLNIAGTSAATAFMKPIASVLGQATGRPELSKNLDKVEEAAIKEGEKQGVGTKLPAFAGSMLGAAPYFAAASEMLPAGLGAVDQGALVGGLGGGAYEGAAAEPGKRLESAAVGAGQGAVLGAGIPALLHGAGKLLSRAPESVPVPERAQLPAPAPSALPAPEPPRFSYRPDGQVIDTTAIKGEENASIPSPEEQNAGNAETGQSPQEQISPYVAETRAQQLGIQRAPNVPPDKVQLETAARQRLAMNPNDFIDAYKEKFGNEFNSDNAAELFPEYSANDDTRALNRQAVSAPARWVSDQAYYQALEAPDGPDRVVFTAGGYGAGKSTAAAGPLEDGAIVYDSTLTNPAAATQRIDAALTAGKNVDIVYVHRDPVDAYKAAMDRATEEGAGRLPPIDAHIKSHQDAAAALPQIAAKYADDPRVTVSVLNNKGTGGNAPMGSIESVANQDYTGIRNALDDTVADRFASGNLSEAQYEAATGQRPSTDRAISTGSNQTLRGQSGASNEGPTQPGLPQAPGMEGAQEPNVPTSGNAASDQTLNPRFATGPQGPSSQPIPMRERPTGLAGTTGGAPLPGAPPEASAMTWLDEPGKAASMFTSPNRTDVWHESLHRMVMEQGIDAEPILKEVDPSMAEKLATALPNQRLYGETPHEETFVRLATAVRTGDEPTIQKFVDADGSKEEVLTFAQQQAKAMQAELAKRADSPQRGIAERKLQEVIRRSGQAMKDLQDETSLNGNDFKTQDGLLYFRKQGEEGWRVFTDREKLLNYMDEANTFPKAQEFAGAQDALPGTPTPPSTGGPDSRRYSTYSDPVPPPRDTPVRSGASSFSYYFRDFMPWVQSVAKKNSWPQLYDAMDRLNGKQAEMEKFTRPYEEKLAGMFKGISGARRNDLYSYMELKERAARGLSGDDQVSALSDHLKLTPKEMEAAKNARDFLDGLSGEFGVNPLDMVAEYVPRMRQRNFDPDFVKTQEFRAPDNLKPWFKEQRVGTLDPRETDLLKVLHGYLKAGAKEKFLTDAVKQARDLINEKIPTSEPLGEYTDKEGAAAVSGNLKDILNRHLDFMLGRPDKSQTAVESFVREFRNALNDGVKSVNKKSPRWLQLPELPEAGNDSVRKMMLLQYAGGLGFRAAMPIRHLAAVLQSYPMLGEVPMMKGIGKAMSKGSWDLADKFGVLSQDNNIGNMIAGDNPSLTGKLGQVATASMKPTKYAVNWSRVATFQGFLSKVTPAIKDYLEGPQTGADVKKLLRDSGMHWLDPQQATKYVNLVKQGGDMGDVAGRAAADLTKLAQFSTTKGAQAGMYKYEVGRIFGQYGTWPMHYLEYLRRLTSGGTMDSAERAKALSRAVLYHTAILKAGEAIGADTGNWVFGGPAAFGGSPNFNALRSVLPAMNMNSQEGKDARRNLVDPLVMMMPGIAEAKGIYRAIENGDTGNDLYLRVLGFNPMTSQKEKMPIHEASAALDSAVQ